jgi:uncharacterized protein (DUF2141 family)
MKRIKFLSVFLFLTIAIPLFSQSSSKATLEIKFTGIRNSKGQIAIGINRSPEGWPRQPHMDPNWKKSNIADGVFTVEIPNLSYGTYAISVLDDENSNLEMDMFMGIPKEGWGFSRNPPMKMSPPKFEECSFEITKPFQQVTINLRYLGKDK